MSCHDPYSLVIVITTLHHHLERNHEPQILGWTCLWPPCIPHSHQLSYASRQFFRLLLLFVLVLLPSLLFFQNDRNVVYYYCCHFLTINLVCVSVCGVLVVNWALDIQVGQNILDFFDMVILNFHFLLYCVNKCFEKKAQNVHLNDHDAFILLYTVEVYEIPRFSNNQEWRSKKMEKFLIGLPPPKKKRKKSGLIPANGITTKILTSLTERAKEVRFCKDHFCWHTCIIKILYASYLWKLFRNYNQLLKSFVWICWYTQVNIWGRFQDSCGCTFAFVIKKNVILKCYGMEKSKKL